MNQRATRPIPRLAYLVELWMFIGAFALARKFGWPIPAYLIGIPASAVAALGLVAPERLRKLRVLDAAVHALAAMVGLAGIALLINTMMNQDEGHRRRHERPQHDSAPPSSR